MRYKNYHWGDLTQARFEARAAGVDNAVLCTADGRLAEGPGFNVFVVKDGRLVTPEHIKPTWYYTPFYAMLRVVPNKLAGVLTMFSAILVLFFLPWLDRGKVKSWRYRGTGFRIALFVLGICFVWLGKIGSGPGTDPVETIIGRFLTAAYFGFFIFLWVYTAFGFEKTKAVPERVNDHD